MKYFLGFIVGGIVVSAITAPARKAAMLDALGLKSAADKK